MLQSQAQQSEVVAGLSLEPRRELKVDPPALLQRQLTQRCLSNEIVCECKRTVPLDQDSVVDELPSRAVNSAKVPRQQERQIPEHQWPSDDGQYREQCGRVGAKSTQTGGDHVACVRIGVIATDEGRDPERRAPRTGPQRFCPFSCQSRRQLGSEKYPFFSGQRLEPKRYKTLLRQKLFERRQEGIRVRTRPGRDDQADGLVQRLCSPHQVVAEGQRLLVSPLEIVSDDQRGAEGAERPMGGLEDAQRLQSTRRRWDVIQEIPETGSVAWCDRKGPQQVACGS